MSHNLAENPSTLGQRAQAVAGYLVVTIVNDDHGFEEHENQVSMKESQLTEHNVILVCFDSVSIEVVAASV